LLFDGCNNRRNTAENTESVTEYLNDTITYYKNEIGQEIAHRKTIQGGKESLQILLTKQIDSTRQLKRMVSGFKKVDAAGNITQLVKVDSVFIPYYSDTRFRSQSKNYFVEGFATDQGLKINTLEIPNTLSFVIGKTKGFFNSEYRIEAVNSNELIKTIGLDSYTFKERPKRLGIGLQVGYGLGANFSLAPYIGIGVSYNLIRF